MRKKFTAALVCLGLAIGSLWLALASAHVATSQRATIITAPAAMRTPAATIEAQQLPQAVMLVINEYLADPPDGLAGDANDDGTRDSTQDEFIELVNSDAAPLNIGGFTISDATQVRFTIPANKIIPPGEAAVIFGGGTPTGAFGNAAANGLVFAIGGSGLALNNGGDTITVKDNTAATVATLTYGSTEGNANQSITRSPDVTGGFVQHSTAPGSGGALFSPGTRINGSPFTTTDPVIDSIAPDVTVAGSGDVSITVAGQNFQAASVVRVDGSRVSTMFVSAMQLDAIVPMTITSVIGAHAVTVENPGPVVSHAVTFTVLSTIGINEYLADPPDGLAGDANGDGTRSSSEDEFIEVVNRTGAPINVGGFTVHDADALRFTFPTNTIIPAGEAAVIFGGGTPTGEFGNARVNGLVFKATLSLNNGGDTIFLFDAANQLIECIPFGSTEGGANQSINRNPEIIGTALVPHSGIPASLGRLFSPGTRVNGTAFTVGPRITDIMPDNAPLHADPFDMAIHGSDFEATATALIDGNMVATRFVSPGELTARVPAHVTAVAGEHQVVVRHEGGNRSNPAVLAIIPPPPQLSDVLPHAVAQGSPSFSLFVRGENFSADARVLVEGNAVTTTVANSRELRATVPASFAASLGTRRVRVRNNDGKESIELSFEVIPVSARITTLTPTQVVAGSPGFTMTINGAGFKTGAGMMFDDTLLATTFVSTTQLRAEVPATLVNAPGLHVVQERNSDGGLSNQVIFFVLANPPLVHTIDPPFVIEGAGDVVITITGERFAPGALARLTENNQPGARLATTFVTGTRLTAFLPARFTQSAGDLAIQVENPDFGVSNAATFKVFIRDPLIINEYLADPPGSATTDLIGDANGDGSRSSAQDEFVEIINRTSEAIDLSGYKLSDADEVRHVFAAGTLLPPFEVTVVFGGGKPKGSFGNAAEEHLVFTASTGGLSLNNGGDSIKLVDAQGRVVQEIKFGSAEGGANQSINRDPDGNGATFALHTQVAHDSGSLFSPGARVTGGPFLIKPSVQSLTPAQVHAGAASFTLAVAGSNFAPGAVVLLSNTTLATVFRSDILLEAEVSAALVTEGGLLEIRVRNPKGEVSAAAVFLVFDDAPRLARLTPDRTGTGAEDIELTIEGERFQRGAVVIIGSETIATSFVSKAALKAMLPASLFTKVGTINAQVKNADGNLSNTLTIAVDYGPLLTRLVPRRLHAGKGAVELTVGGVAFMPDVTLFVNEVAVPTTFVSDTSFTARIPAEMTAQAGRLTLQARHVDGGRSNRWTLRVIR